MKSRRTLRVLVIAAMGLCSFATAASATTVTSPKGTFYTGSVTWLANSWNLSGTFVTMTCKNAFNSKVESHGGVLASGNVSGMVFTECNYPNAGINLGTLAINSSGTVTWSGVGFTFQTSVGTCGFSTNGTQLGTLTGGSKAVLGVASAKIPRTHGNFLCGSSGTLNATYVVENPTSLYVH